jgi:hypothetical protein
MTSSTEPQPVTPAPDGAGGRFGGGDHQDRLLGELQQLRGLAADVWVAGAPVGNVALSDHPVRLPPLRR